MNKVQIDKLLEASRKFTFYMKDEKACVDMEKIDFRYRGQDGWDGISQKICVTDDGTMSMGISVIKPGGSMNDIPTAHEFVDFLLYGNGSVIVDGVGELQVKQGDFLNFKEKVVRTSENSGKDVIIGIWYQKASPSYKFE